MALLVLALGDGCAPVTGSDSGQGLDAAGGPFEGGTGGDDGGIGTGDASSCHPGDVQTYTPSAYRPATAAGQGACRMEQLVDPIKLYYDSCLGPIASKTACEAFKAGYGACAACILTRDTADHYGPLIAHDGFVSGNVAGCLELTGVPGGLSCAKALQARDGCDLAACEANCPVRDEASFAAFNRCTSEADMSGCQSLELVAVACTAAAADAGADSGVDATKCLVPSFKDFYDGVVPLFCGSPPQAADAGGESDSASD